MSGIRKFFTITPILVGFLFSLLGFQAKIAFASTIVSQPVSSATESHSGSLGYHQSLGKGLSGVVGSISVRLATQSSTAHPTLILIDCGTSNDVDMGGTSCDTQNSGSYLGYWKAYDSMGTTTTSCSITSTLSTCIISFKYARFHTSSDGATTTGITLDPTHYYKISMSGGGSNGLQTGGSSSSLVTGKCVYSQSGSDTNCSTVLDMYYLLDDNLNAGSSLIYNTLSYFTSYIPVIGTTTPQATSTSFTFGASGYVDPTEFVSGKTNLYIRYKQSTGMGQRGNSIVACGGDFTLPISSSGTFTLSSTTSVLCSGVYNIYYAIQTPRFDLFGIGFLTKTLVDTIGSVVIGSASDSEILSNQQLINSNLSVNTGVVDNSIPTEETASSTILGLSSAFGLRDAIFRKFPINWVVEYAKVLTDLQTQVSTTTIPEAKINYGASITLLNKLATTSTINLNETFFSGAVFDQVSTLPGIQLMRTFVSLTLWIGLMGYAWRSVAGMFKKNSG